MDDSIFTTRLKQLDPQYSQFVASKFPVEAAKALGEKAGLAANSIDVLENAFVLYLLFTLTFDEMVDFITKECGPPEDEALSLGYAFLATLPEGFAEQQAQSYNALNVDSEPSNSQLSDDINEAQELMLKLESVKQAEATTPTQQTPTPIPPPAPTPIPTPPENVYSTSQETLLRESQKVPTPEEVTQKWDSAK